LQLLKYKTLSEMCQRIRLHQN